MESNVAKEYCIVCSIKSDTLIHTLMLPEKIQIEMDFLENVYKTTRNKIKNLGTEYVCSDCKNDLKVVFTFRKNCLYSRELMEQINNKIADNHRVLIEHKFIDVGLFEGVEESYIYPANVTSRIFDKTTDLEEIPATIDKDAVLENEIYVEELDTEDIIYDPIDNTESSLNEEQIKSEQSDIDVSEDQVNTKTENIKQEESPNTSQITLPKLKKFKCDQCKISYMRLTTLHIHKWKRHKIPIPVEPKKKHSRADTLGEKDIYFGVDLTRTCEYCFLEHETEKELQEHLATMHQEIPKKYSCKLCTKLFKSKENLRTHFLAIHSDVRREFKCGYCEKAFFHKRSLQSHEEIQHLGVKGAYVCDICGQKSNSKGDLNRHKLRHQKVKPYPCPYDDCDKRFTTHHEVTSHIRFKHTKEKPFPCNFCKLQFATSSARLNHIKVHTRAPDERPYKCNHCPKSYSWKDNLDRHIKMHLDQKDYVCKICNAAFLRIDGLNKHMKRLHGTDGAERPYKCQHCACGFADPSALKRHVTIFHKNASS